MKLLNTGRTFKEKRAGEIKKRSTLKSFFVDNQQLIAIIIRHFELFSRFRDSKILKCFFRPAPYPPESD